MTAHPRLGREIIRFLRFNVRRERLAIETQRIGEHFIKTAHAVPVAFRQA